MLANTCVRTCQWQTVRLFRLFNILDELRLRRTPVTARALADAMGVSTRTLYRDIADLQAMGAPIRGEGGLGYVMTPGFFMPALSFDEEELAALAMGIRMAAARGDLPLSSAARRAAAKIAASLGESSGAEFLDAPLQAGPSSLAQTPHLATLRQAIRRRSVLELDYTSLKDVSSTRRARPLGLTSFDTVWLLTIWCDTANDFRHLRVDRIGAIRDTGERYRDERGKRFADSLDRENRNMQQNTAS